MFFQRLSAVLLIACFAGCSSFNRGNGTTQAVVVQTPMVPTPVIPPVIFWDSSYSEPMGTPQTATIRRGIVKIICQFPDEDEQPKWIKALVEYKNETQDGALARMQVFTTSPGMYVLQLVGAAQSVRQVVHIEWLTQTDQRGSYDILIEHGVMRPTPALPTNTLARP